MSVDLGCQRYQSVLSGVAGLARLDDSPEIICIAGGDDRHQSVVRWSYPRWFPARQEEHQAHFELV
jgi:hypothetical protein